MGFGEEFNKGRGARFGRDSAAVRPAYCTVPSGPVSQKVLPGGRTRITRHQVTVYHRRVSAGVLAKGCSASAWG